MKMIKQAMEYFKAQSETKVMEIKERQYTSDSVYPVLEPEIKSRQTQTLTSIIDYLKSNPDEIKGNKVIHIESPTKVTLSTGIFGDFRQHDKLIDAVANIPRLNVGSWMDNEEFIIELQAKYTKFMIENADKALTHTSGDKEALLKVIGNLKTEAVKKHSDDGISQKVEIKQGITTVAEAVVPNPVLLAPFRTFPEIDQVPSQFIFRMRENRGVEMALFEADGGAWEMETIQRIKAYMEAQIKEHGIENVTILA